MARSDYDHWNEEADRVWWEEEGRFPLDPPDPDDDDLDRYGRYADEEE